jgi:hypothetical protein
MTQHYYSIKVTMKDNGMSTTEQQTHELIVREEHAFVAIQQGLFDGLGLTSLEDVQSIHVEQLEPLYLRQESRQCSPVIVRGE